MQNVLACIEDEECRDLLVKAVSEPLLDESGPKLRLLAALEASGLLATSNASGKKVFTLTDVGRLCASALSQFDAKNEIEQVFSRMPLDESNAFLDLGCGAGVAILRAKKFSPRLIVGLDINFGLLRIAATIAGTSPEKIFFVQGDMENLPFKTAAFTNVCSRLSLPYVDQGKAFRELARISQASGVIFLHLHSLKFYLRVLIRQITTVKRLMLNGFCLLNGTIFHLFGYQLAIQTRRGKYQELFQTMARTQKLLRDNGFLIRWTDSKYLQVLGRKI